MFEFVVGLLIHGLITGSMYAAVALGLTLTYGIMGILNFAQGAMVGVALLALVVERTTFRFARGEHLNGLVISLGLIAILQNSALAIWGADPLSIPPPLPQIVEFAGTGVGLQRLVASGVTLALIVAVMLFLKVTSLGKVTLGDDKISVSHVAISPDGKTALASRDGTPERIGCGRASSGRGGSTTSGQSANSTVASDEAADSAAPGTRAVSSAAVSRTRDQSYDSTAAYRDGANPRWFDGAHYFCSTECTGGK